MKNESLMREVYHNEEDHWVRSYSEMLKYPTLEERFEYLRLNGVVGEELFGYTRYLNQEFYHGSEWYDRKAQIVIRDKGCDLGVPGCKIVGPVYVHHINPITIEMIRGNSPMLYDPENLISCSFRTHQAITYGNLELLPRGIVVRRPNDTCPWRDDNAGINSGERAVCMRP